MNSFNKINESRENRQEVFIQGSTTAAAMQFIRDALATGLITLAKDDSGSNSLGEIEGRCGQDENNRVAITVESGYQALLDMASKNALINCLSDSDIANESERSLYSTINFDQRRG